MRITQPKKIGRAALLEEMVVQLQIGNTAVKKAQDKNRRLGIPNVYSVGGKIVRVSNDNGILLSIETCHKE